MRDPTCPGCDREYDVFQMDEAGETFTCDRCAIVFDADGGNVRT
ncbi:hypothetical protein [Halanaeroarchaeum sp. HSR-CO]|nr:hypothetical protein [Halanaeroarchaeum sp. HSR-CO]